MNITYRGIYLTNSLIEELPKIVKRGKKEANRILENLSNENRLTLQTNKLVLPSKDEKDILKIILRIKILINHGTID